MTTPVGMATGRVVPSSWHDGRRRGSGRYRAHAGSGQRSLLPGKGRSPVRSGSTVDLVGGVLTGGGVVDGAVVVSGSGATADPP